MPAWDFNAGGFYHHVSLGMEVLLGLHGGFYGFPDLRRTVGAAPHAAKGKDVGWIEVPFRITLVRPAWLEWGAGIAYRRVYLDSQPAQDGTDYKQGGMHLVDLSGRLGLVLPFFNLGATAHLQISADQDVGWFATTDAMFHY
jgi:hypothetical protein